MQITDDHQFSISGKFSFQRSAGYEIFYWIRYAAVYRCRRSCYGWLSEIRECVLSLLYDCGRAEVELREGIWQGSGYSQNLKLINVPVLKSHRGSRITASLKHLYGVLSMTDGQIAPRHYTGLGNTCGKMVVSVRTPVLNIIDAVWVSHASLRDFLPTLRLERISSWRARTPLPWIIGPQNMSCIPLIITPITTLTYQIVISGCLTRRTLSTGAEACSILKQASGRPRYI